ncbi:MAG: tetratricopeptide repeat protein [Candidatus Cloacimonetes bacterium]|nr:tetratricopeptide repeat protein [Candidatus Cloacimonadota bacterium]
MPKFYLISFLIFIFTILFADDSLVIEAFTNGDLQQAELLLQDEDITKNNLELWRQLGFAYKENGETEKAISGYQKVFSFNNNDYDALLALARLYFHNQQFELSRQYFRKILTIDSTDVEAFLGLARMEKSRENFSESIIYYNSALKYLPEHFPALFELANVYIYSDNLQNAINTYHRILEIDNTWSEAWSGIGKMYWWQDKPFLALGNYKKAIELDPENKEIIQEFKNIKNAVNWNISAKYFGQSEIEENYQIDSFNQQYSISKRVTDILSLNINSFLQYAQKDETDFITEKYYDTTFLKSNLKITLKNEINFTIGGSISDSVFTIIEGGWQFKTNWKNLKVTNNINLGNEYFYHWERVRRSYIQEDLIINWQKMDFNCGYQFGKVEDNTISILSQNGNSSVSSYNSFLNYNFRFNYQVLKSPIIEIGSNYRFIDYQYESSLYYTPIDRKILGLSGSLYYPYKCVYFYLGSGVNFDNYRELETGLDAEFGVDLRGLSLSVSFSNFKNQYYESKSLSFIIGGNF